DNAIATMYPFRITTDHCTTMPTQACQTSATCPMGGTCVNEQSTLHLDDIASVSALYPGASFASSFGKITGTVVLANGEGAFQGAYVVARQVGSGRVNAVGGASGARFVPHNPGGSLPSPQLRALYELPVPPGNYTVEIEAIDPMFTGAASVGPLDPPAPLPSLTPTPGQPVDFWNGTCPPAGTPTPAAGCESNTNPPDNPTQSVPITVTAGNTASGIDLILNGAVTGPANDRCTAPTVIGSLPFATALSTTAATIGIFDPILNCILLGGADQNTHSVWFSFTAPSNGTVTANTTVKTCCNPANLSSCNTTVCTTNADCTVAPNTRCAGTDYDTALA